MTFSSKHVQYVEKAVITLNGVELNNCFFLDEELGIALCYDTEPLGNGAHKVNFVPGTRTRAVKMLQGDAQITVRK